MILARVIGNIASTMKHQHYEGKKILVVKPINLEGKTSGKPLLAVDAVQAGIGDLVIVFDEGGSARSMLHDEHGVTIRTVIGGIIDSVSEEKEA